MALDFWKIINSKPPGKDQKNLKYIFQKSGKQVDDWTEKGTQFI